jgi:phosphoglycolate phosphatase
MKYNSVVFDLDGTLLNTLPDIVLILNTVIEQIGMTEKTEAQIRAGVGFGVEHLLRYLGVPEQWNSALASEVEGRYARIKESRATLYPGVREMILELKTAGIKMGILSNKPQQGLEKTVSEHLAFAEFVSVRGSKPGKPSKANPDELIEMLRVFKTDRSSVLVAGDGEPDIQVSLAAGVDCVSVLWGFRTKDALEKSGACMFAETPRDVVRFILKEQ